MIRVDLISLGRKFVSRSEANGFKRYQFDMDRTEGISNLRIHSSSGLPSTAVKVLSPIDWFDTNPLQFALDLGQDLVGDENQLWLDEDIEPCSGQTFDGLPEPIAWARTLTVGVAESLAGTRAPQQLLRWLDYHIYRGLVHQCPRRVNPRGLRPIVVSVKVFEGTHKTFEGCSVVRFGRRSRALAMQFRPFDSKWRCCSLIIG